MKVVLSRAAARYKSRQPCITAGVLGEVLDANTTVALQLLDANITVALLTDQLLVANNKIAVQTDQYALAMLADASAKSKVAKCVALLLTANEALDLATINRARVDIQLKEAKAKFTAAKIVLAKADICHNTACTTGLPVRLHCAECEFGKYCTVECQRVHWDASHD
jgi:hypothetical protein